MRIFFMGFWLTFSGCVSAAVGVVGGAVDLATDAVVTTVDVTTDVVGTAVDVIIPDDKKEDDEK